jgi:hypothetical protein
MYRFKNKRVISLAIAVIMAVSILSLSASASGSSVGLAPPVNSQLWYTNTTFTTQFPQNLLIGTTTYNFTLGNNTIQEYFYDSASSNYVVSVHPQFFGTAVPLDYDDQTNAYYIMNITEILVYDSEATTYVDCFSDGVAVISAKLALPSPSTPVYLQCMVYSTIVDVRTGATQPAAWNGKVVYLQIPAGV